MQDLKKYGWSTLFNVVIICIIATVLKAYVVDVGWQWFITPLYEIKSPGLVTILALQIMSNLFRMSRHNGYTEEQKKNLIVTVIGQELFAPLIGFGILYVYTFLL